MAKQVQFKRSIPNGTMLGSRSRANPEQSCPPGKTVCGDALPGYPPICCPIEIQGPTPASSSVSPAKCWGPAWDRGCKLCLPTPTAASPNKQTCAYWREGDRAGYQRALGLIARTQRSQAKQRLDVYGRWYTPRGGSRSL